LTLFLGIGPHLFGIAVWKARDAPARNPSSLLIPGDEDTTMHYLLFYDVVDDYTTRRQPHRGAHLKYAKPFVERGELLLGGALAEPVDQAVLLFESGTPAVAEAFAVSDPYVLQGVVTSWQVRPWTTVIGRQAAVPLPAESVQ
jgi:uncharacterized protein YciI